MRTIEEIKAEIEKVEAKMVAYWTLPDEEGKDANSAWQEQRERYHRKDELEDELLGAMHQAVKVGDGITLLLYSDRNAYTVINRTDKTLTIQRDKATLKEGWKPEYVPGGFSAICLNQDEQEWDYKPNKEGEIIKLHWSEKRKRWNAPRGYSSVCLGRHEFYDYNF